MRFEGRESIGTGAIGEVIVTTFSDGGSRGQGRTSSFDGGGGITGGGGEDVAILKKKN